MKIFLAGGGTGGPTTPLLAVASELKKLTPSAKIFFIGHKGRVDRRFLEDLDFRVEYLSLPAGKWRRYFSILNFTDLFKTAFGFFKGLYLIHKFRPDVVIGAGSFVQVPLMWAAHFTRVPVLVHQQDLHPLLSTKLVAPIADVITVSFNLTTKELPVSSGLFQKKEKDRVFWTGNPVRRAILEGSLAKARQMFKLRGALPVLLVMGGGSGARSVNFAVESALPELLKYVEVIHITGGKSSRLVREQLAADLAENYHDFAFLGADLAHAYAAADLVLSRGGMASISELSALKKPAILVPLSGAQEENARFLAFLKAAVGVLEEHLDGELIVRLVRKILWSREIQETLKGNIAKVMPHDADKKIAKLAIKIYENSRQTK